MSGGGLLCGQDLVVHVVQRGAVSHMERPKQSVPLLLDLLSLEMKPEVRPALIANITTTVCVRVGGAVRPVCVCFPPAHREVQHADVKVQCTCVCE